MQPVSIAGQMIGPGHPCYVVAEVGINHNGDVNVARDIIEAALDAKCDAVKFQKRTIDVVYTKEELDKPRESPFGTTNREQKEGLEFGPKEYEYITSYCREMGVVWFASCWDEKSVDFVEAYKPPAYKIASASLTDDNLLKHGRSMGKPVILSTGMSFITDIDHAVEVLGTEKLIILQCTSTYPTAPDELDLRVIPVLAERYGVPIGFSDHTPGIPASVVARTLGACMIEKHVTKSRVLYGSDQAASLEPAGLRKMVDYIHYVDRALGSDSKRMFRSEGPIAEKLRRVPPHKSWRGSP